MSLKKKDQDAIAGLYMEGFNREFTGSDVSRIDSILARTDEAMKQAENELQQLRWDDPDFLKARDRLREILLRGEQTIRSIGSNSQYHSVKNNQ